MFLKNAIPRRSLLSSTMNPLYTFSLSRKQPHFHNHSNYEDENNHGHRLAARLTDFSKYPSFGKNPHGLPAFFDYLAQTLFQNNYIISVCNIKR